MSTNLGKSSSNKFAPKNKDDPKEKDKSKVKGNSLKAQTGPSGALSGSLSTPTRSSSVQKRPLSSPEETSSSKRAMGIDDNSQLLASINAMLDSKMMHLATKEDVNSLREDIRLIQRENEKLVTQVKLLTVKCEEQEKRLEILENHVRRKNLIIRGCRYKKEDNIEEMARSFFTEVMRVSEPVKINESRRIGSKNGEGNLILVSLSSVSEKWSLINKANALKNSGFSIAQDLAPITRFRRNKLLAVRATCRRNPKGAALRMNLRGDRLFVNDKAYLWDDKLGLTINEGGNLLAIDMIEGIDLKSLRASPPGI